MRDFKYPKLLMGRPEWEVVLKKINGVRSDCLKECAAAFSINLKRMTSFAGMPAQIAFMVRRDQIFYDNAVFKATGKVEIKLSDLLNPPPHGLQEEVDRQMEEFRNMPDIELRKLVASLGINYVEAVIPIHAVIQDSLDAMLASIVLGSWTAFECLVSDLWAIGVDKGPKEVAVRLSVSNQLQKPDETRTPPTGIGGGQHQRQRRENADHQHHHLQRQSAVRTGAFVGAEGAFHGGVSWVFSEANRCKSPRVSRPPDTWGCRWKER
jgi:hypothetical protein